MLSTQEINAFASPWGPSLITRLETGKAKTSSLLVLAHEVGHANKDGINSISKARSRSSPPWAPVAKQ